MNVTVLITGVKSSEAMDLAIEMKPVLAEYLPKSVEVARVLWIESALYIRIGLVDKSFDTRAQPPFITVIGGNLSPELKKILSQKLHEATGLDVTVG